MNARRLRGGAYSSDECAEVQEQRAPVTAVQIAVVG